MNQFVHALERPRKIILMVNAGAAVDAVIDELSKELESGDIIIDAGNSHYQETCRRMDLLKREKMHFVGAGVSGGELGALLGPSIMPSGDEGAYQKVKVYLETIAAKDINQGPCCTYVGREGSGHFVKMIHNGIEYAEMQLLAECYSILKDQGKSNEEMADTFSEWMKDQSSYLLGITIDILRKKEGEAFLLDQVLDKAANKGTGKWASATIANSGEPATMIPAALFARYLSFFKEKRLQSEAIFSIERITNNIAVDQLKEAYEFARTVNHHQGFSLIKRVSDQNGWHVNLSEIARIWTNGCIIKSDLMRKIAETPDYDDNLMFQAPWRSLLMKSHPSIQKVVIECIESQIHIPCFAEAINYFHGIKIGHGSANLIQAQRDYFGAHGYKRKDDAEGSSHHSNWAG
ncbi:UNVERIFIED_CONTAM: hypothetical protein GTU68_057492 [Idotea baltica]|nr:hypothetical protein [Idotea baltica]